MFIQCYFVAVVVLVSIVESQVQLAPRDVQVCPDSQTVVVITCNETRSRLRWRIEAPPMLSDTVFVTDQDPIGTMEPFESRTGLGVLPGVNLTVHSLSDAFVSSSVFIDTTNYNLTGSEISVSCGSTIDPPFASVRLWGMQNVFHDYIVRV